MFTVHVTKPAEPNLSQKGSGIKTTLDGVSTSDSTSLSFCSCCMVSLFIELLLHTVPVCKTIYNWSPFAIQGHTNVIINFTREP